MRPVPPCLLFFWHTTPQAQIFGFNYFSTELYYQRVILAESQATSPSSWPGLLSECLALCRGVCIHFTIIADSSTVDTLFNYPQILPPATSSMVSLWHLAVLTTLLDFKDSVFGRLLFPHKLIFRNDISQRQGGLWSRALVLHHGSS